MKIRSIFTDFGGVLLTNGWGRDSRKAACEQFHLDYDDVDERHHLTFDTYEVGQLSLDEYLRRLVFFTERSFTPDDFKEFMFSRSKPYPEMIDMIRKLKAAYGLQVIGVSNEGRELAQYRVDTFNMREYIDAFVVSGFVYTRKPDVSIFNLALDIAQAKPQESVYIDDRMLFVEVASSLGFVGVHHVTYEETKYKLAELGLGL